MRTVTADLTGKMRIRMRIFGRPLQTAMSYLCALCQLLPLSFVDADDDYDDDYSNRKVVFWLLYYQIDDDRKSYNGFKLAPALRATVTFCLMTSRYTIRKIHLITCPTSAKII